MNAACTGTHIGRISMRSDRKTLAILLGIAAIAIVLVLVATFHQNNDKDETEIVYELNDDMTAGVEDVKGNPTTLTIPSQTEIDGKTYTVTYVAYGALDKCDRIQNLNLPSTLEYIDEGTLDVLFTLRNIDVAKGNEYYGSMDGVLFDARIAFLVKYPASKTDTSYTIPESAWNIADLAFDGASKLRSVVLHDGIYTIGNYAFRNCSSLESISIPESLAVLGIGALIGCESLERIDVDPMNKNYESDDGVLYQIGGCKLLQYPVGSEAADFTVPADVAEIAEGAFAKCTNLRSITLNECLTDITARAFEGCSSLATVHNNSCLPIEKGSETYGSVAKYASSVDGDVSIYMDDDGLIFSCNSKSMFAQVVGYRGTSTELSLDPVVTIDGKAYEVGSIGIMAFLGSGLTEIDIPASVRMIAKAAFYGCGSLISFGAMDGLMFIGESAFSGCVLLSKVDMESGIRFIDDGAFDGISTITKIEFSNELIYVGFGAFSGMHFYVDDVEVLPTAEYLAGSIWTGTGDGRLDNE